MNADIKWDSRTNVSGNFVWSSDSRFANATAGYPVSVHDRSETTKEYAAYAD